MNRKSGVIAAALSFVFPGLGHAYLGRRRAAMVFGLPAVVTTAAMLTELALGLDGLIAYVITPAGAMTTLVLVLLTGLWRAIAVADCVLIARRVGDSRPRLALGAGAVVLVAVIAMHAAPAYLAWSMYDASSHIFVGSGPDQAQVTQAPASSDFGSGTTSPSASDDPNSEYQATPGETPATPSSRINILLTGIDAFRTRSEALNDTLLVVSLNPVDGSVAMLSLPRDLSNFPLFNGKTYSGKINSLMTFAAMHPTQFPDGPLPTLIKEVGYLIGVPIHYYAAVNLDGFRRMVDLVGGVTVTNDRAINDPRYDWLDGSPPGLFMPAGTQTLNGRMALAFVRSRQGLGDSDFTRARRQQALLLALRTKLTSPSMLPKLPGILQIAGDTVRTNLPSDRLEEFITLARNVDTKSVQQFVLGPPYATSPPMSTTGGVYTLVLDMKLIMKLSIRLFGSDSRYYTGP